VLIKQKLELSIFFEGLLFLTGADAKGVFQSNDFFFETLDVFLLSFSMSPGDWSARNPFDANGNQNSTD
jgi:hypothetical protein